VRLGGRRADPTRGVVRRRFQLSIQAIFTAQARFQDVELQRPDHTHDPIGADLRLEDLRHAFFGQAGQGAGQVLLLHRIEQLDAAQDFGREASI